MLKYNFQNLILYLIIKINENFTPSPFSCQKVACWLQWIGDSIHTLPNGADTNTNNFGYIKDSFNL